MSKRRNLKKEKALRNLAYARKFRKRSNSRNYRGGRRPSSGTDAESNEEENSTETEGGAT